MTETPFSKLPDDVVLNIFSKLEDHPKSWACLACVCTKFSSLIRNTCWKHKCSKTIPAFCADLLTSSSSSSPAPPGGWASLHKLSVCCPGLHHAGVLLENSDFGLERELGPDENYLKPPPSVEPCSSTTTGGPPRPEPGTRPTRVRLLLVTLRRSILRHRLRHLRLSRRRIHQRRRRDSRRARIFDL